MSSSKQLSTKTIRSLILFFHRHFPSQTDLQATATDSTKADSSKHFESFHQTQHKITTYR